MSLDLRTKSNSELSYSPSSSSWKRQQRRDDKLVEEDKHQRIVQTPYGRGLIIRTRCGNNHDEKNQNPLSVGTTSYEIRLLEWENAGETPHGKGSTILTNIRPMLYTSINYPSVTPRVGDDVICTFGRGRVVDVIPVIITPKKDTNTTTTSNNNNTNEGGAATNVKEEEEQEGGEGDHFDDSTEHEEKKESVTVTARTTTTTTKEGMDDDSPITTEEALSRKGARIFPKYVVSLTSWRLANRSTVQCYLTPERNDPLFSVVRKKTLGEMDAYERVELAQTQKSLATQQFVQKNYQRALLLYAGAVDAVRYVQHDANSSNEVRADLVEAMVTCSNNAATCCAQLHRWTDAIQFASSALVLLDALYAKRGKKIHLILNKDGLPDEKLFGEWKVKSCLLLARAYAERGEHDDAIDVLKKAREVIGAYLPSNSDKIGDDDVGKDVKDETPSKTNSLTAITAAAATSRKHLAAQDKEVRRLLASCIQRKKAEKRKEKQRAQAMFGGSGGGGGGSNSSLSSDKGSSKKEGSASNGGSNKGGSVTDLDSKSSKENGTVGKKAKSSSRGLLDMRDNDSDKDEAKGYREDEQELDELDELLKKETIGAKGGRAKDDGTKQKTVKKVSFSDVNEVRERANEEEDSDEDEEDVPWFQEHMEALILLGSVGLVGLSMLLLRGRSRG